MIRFPNCKINLGLYVTGQRPDGFHELQTGFYPIPFYDVLEVISSPQVADTSLSLSGITIDAKNNSCVNAYGLLKKSFPQLPPVEIHLHKAIPAGGGLGGGSADGAFMLKLLNEKFDLKLDAAALMQYAAQLGSDCPFFIQNTPCLARGRGEILESISLDLSAYKIVVVNPGIHVSTGWAFSKIRFQGPELPLDEILHLPVPQWKEHLINVFEPPVFQTHPTIQEIKDALYQQGAVYASMSGSGATVYGLFKKADVVQLHFPPHYLVKEC